MTKMKISELTGPALDWAVAKCAEPEWGEEGWLCHCTYPDDDGWIYSPSTDWSQGGPIIEQRITKIEDYGDCWGAEGPDARECFGPTPLIAAMRAFVASKLGDEVDVPEGLQ